MPGSSPSWPGDHGRILPVPGAPVHRPEFLRASVASRQTVVRTSAGSTIKRLSRHGRLRLNAQRRPHTDPTITIRPKRHRQKDARKPRPQRRRARRTGDRVSKLLFRLRRVHALAMRARCEVSSAPLTTFSVISPMPGAYALCSRILGSSLVRSATTTTS